MAIQNASDLLVYKKTSPARAQVTRIKIKSTTPIKDFTAGDNIILNNVTDASGDISDGVVDTLSGVNSGFSICSSISAVLTGTYGYTATGVVNDPNDASFKKFDVTNGANGPVPTLEVLSGTNEFKSGAVEIVVITSGQSLVYQPIAYSTSASLGVSKDLRDITTKDSQGWQENAKGLGSFELSTDALWDVNNAVGVESATEDLIQGDLVDVKFSDRVRNLVTTEEVYGSSEWFISSVQDITKHLEDPFGQFTAAELAISSSTSYAAHFYKAPIQLVEGKKVTWSLYLKAFSATANTCFLRTRIDSDSGSDFTPITSIEKISGTGTVSSPSEAFKKVTGLSTSSWTRVKVTTDSVVSGTDLRTVSFLIYPGADYENQTTADKIITASWQVETGTDASDYQNPTEVDCYQGKAFVNSVSVDAGVEDNATYSASFTGTSEIFINGLGHELLSNNYFEGTQGFDGTTRIIDDWTIHRPASNSTSGFLNPNAILVWSSSANSYLQSSNNILDNSGNITYELEYTISSSTTSSTTSITVGGDIQIPISVGTHKVRFKPTTSKLLIDNGGQDGSIRFSYMSVKQVFS